MAYRIADEIEYSELGKFNKITDKKLISTLKSKLNLAKSVVGAEK